MKAKHSIILLPAIDAGGCSCGASCGPAAKEEARTSNAEALALMQKLEAELGDSLDVSIADYASREGASRAAEALFSGLQERQKGKIKANALNLTSMLSFAGPFLLMDGRIVANRILPSFDELRKAVSREATA